MAERESKVLNLWGGYQEVLRVEGSFVYASFALISLPRDATELGVDARPPISWPTLPTALGWGVISATMNLALALAFGPSHSALAGLRTDLLSLGWVWEVRLGGARTSHPAGPEALSLQPRSRTCSGRTLGGWREAPRPPCGRCLFPAVCRRPRSRVWVRWERLW